MAQARRGASGGSLTRRDKAVTNRSLLIHGPRPALGRIVFADPAKLRWFEQLLHPEARERFRQELAQRA